MLLDGKELFFAAQQSCMCFCYCSVQTIWLFSEQIFFSRDVGWGKTHINISFLQGNKALITHNEGTTMFNNPLNKDSLPWEGWPWGVGQCVLLRILIVGCQSPTLRARSPIASQVVSIYLYACELHALSQMQLREVSREFSTTNDGESIFHGNVPGVVSQPPQK